MDVADPAAGASKDAVDPAIEASAWADYNEAQQQLQHTTGLAVFGHLGVDGLTEKTIALRRADPGTFGSSPPAGALDSEQSVETILRVELDQYSVALLLDLAADEARGRAEQLGLGLTDTDADPLHNYFKACRPQDKATADPPRFHKMVDDMCAHPEAMRDLSLMLMSAACDVLEEKDRAGFVTAVRGRAPTAMAGPLKSSMWDIAHTLASRASQHLSAVQRAVPEALRLSRADRNGKAAQLAFDKWMRFMSDMAAMCDVLSRRPRPGHDDEFSCDNFEKYVTQHDKEGAPALKE